MIHSNNGFLETLPRGPLVQHIGKVHAILLHLYGQANPHNEAVVEMAEHSLREIAAYTAEREYPDVRRFDGSPVFAEPVKPLDPDEVRAAMATAGEMVAKSARDFTASLRKMREARAAAHSPEQRAMRNYRARVEDEKRAARNHLKLEARRISRELGSLGRPIK